MLLQLEMWIFCKFYVTNNLKILKFSINFINMQFYNPRVIKYTLQMKWIILFWKDHGKIKQFY